MNETEELPKGLIEIPYERLDAKTLKAVIESFILREGTNYGAEEIDFQTKIEQVKRQLESKRIRLVFEPESESCTLLTENEFQSRKISS